MRIVSGKLKGRKLASFKGRYIRPTSDKVREAIFDILILSWEGKDVLDLYAGTGGLGIEALSRGARRVVFVENRPQSLLLLEKNVNALNLVERCEVVRLRVEEAMRSIKRRVGKFDVAFLDPPYGKNLAENTLRLIAVNNLLKKNGVAVAEHHYKEILSDRYQRLQMSDQRRYGSTGVSFYINKQDL